MSPLADSFGDDQQSAGRRGDAAKEATRVLKVGLIIGNVRIECDSRKSSYRDHVTMTRECLEYLGKRGEAEWSEDEDASVSRIMVGDFGLTRDGAEEACQSACVCVSG